ncbi:PhzF family phenazine biosynthesis isomerase [Rhodobacterales bacterium HKCCE2091]|nr:PhzF family phenazine biosynthesis isomerase [Rhodobacterales bacterium HKCCE2091]
MLPFFVYDVFTDRPYTGNPLAVVEDAAALGTGGMQAMAKEFNLSETIFVLPPDDPAHTAKVRIFTPSFEMPFAGHPTIGCAVHLALAAAGDGDFDTVIVLEEQAGIVPVTVARTGDTIAAEFTAPVSPDPRPLGLGPGEIASALGLQAGDIGPHTAHVIHGGHPFLHVPVVSTDALSRAWPRGAEFDRLCDTAGTGSVYVYAPGRDCDWDARMFAPASGIAEDPATGSATSLLAGQLLANGTLPTDGRTDLALCQGRDMGRESRLSLSVDTAGGAITAIRVGGSAVRVSEGRILPAG